MPYTLRFRAEPNEADNLRVRVYSQDRSTLLATVVSAGVANPITETIASSGSYECQVSAVGYWYVLVDLVDTGEVTADGFASQWVPEVLDTISAATTGQGDYVVTVTVQDDDLAPVPGSLVTIANAAGTANIAWGTTDADGQILFALDAATYSVSVRGPTSAYAPLTSQALVVSAAAAVTYTLTTQALLPPAAPGLSTVRFLVLDRGNPVVGATCTAELLEDNPMVDTAIVSRAKHTGTTDGSGIADLTMIWHASFTKGGTYRIKVLSQGRCLHDRKVTVPSSASQYAEDLPDA